MTANPTPAPEADTTDVAGLVKKMADHMKDWRVEELVTALTALSAEHDRQREHIRKQAEDIMTLGALVYASADVAWKDRAEAAEATIEALKAERDEARHEASCCDDIGLDQPLSGIISELQSDRERLYAECARLAERVRELEEGLDIDRAVSRAAVTWCGEKDRETSLGDIIYFECNWRALPGLCDYVDRELGRTARSLKEGGRADG